MIVGLGNDLCDISRVQKVLDHYGERFTKRCFTEIERTKSDRRAQRAASYAKRFAAKDVGNLPVVTREKPDRPIGLITRSGLWAALETAKKERAGRLARLKTENRPSTPSLSD